MLEMSQISTHSLSSSLRETDDHQAHIIDIPHPAGDDQHHSSVSSFSRLTYSPSSSLPLPVYSHTAVSLDSYPHPTGSLDLAAFHRWREQINNTGQIQIETERRGSETKSSNL